MYKIQDENVVVACGIRRDTGKPNAFGEMYHVALLAIWFWETYNHPIRIHFYQQEAGRIFLESLAIPFKEVEWPHNKNRIHLSDEKYAETLAYFLSSADGQNVIKFYVKKIRKLSDLDATEKSVFVHVRNTISRKVLVWHRAAEFKAERNSTLGIVSDLAQIITSENYTLVTINLQSEIFKAFRLGSFWQHLAGPNVYIKQLSALDYLVRECGVIGQIGMLSAAMDGPAFFLGLRTCCLERGKSESERMKEFSIAQKIYKFISFTPGETMQGVFMPSCPHCPPQRIADKVASDEIRNWLKSLAKVNSSSSSYVS